jgi:hypothetical protein
MAIAKIISLVRFLFLSRFIFTTSQHIAIETLIERFALRRESAHAILGSIIEVGYDCDFLGNLSSSLNEKRNKDYAV